METVRIHIEDLGHRAMGIGRRDGKVVMVPFAAPGDVLEVRIIKERKSFDEARIERVLEPSPMRVQPPCPFFGRCGGCQLQHICIDDQRGIKEGLFRMELMRHLGTPSQRIAPIVAEGPHLGYRTKLEFHMRWYPKPMMGFMGWGTRELVPVTRCMLAMEKLNDVLGRTCAVLQRCGAKQFIRMEVACDATGPGWTVALWGDNHLEEGPLLCLEVESAQLPHLRSLAVASQRGAKLRQVWRQPAGPRGVLYPLGTSAGNAEVLLEAWPGVFRQVNPAVNAAMLRNIARWAGEMKGGRALDLYAGMGNISLSIYNHLEEVTSVEVNPLAVENGRAVARALGAGNVRWIRSSAKRALKNFLEEGRVFDLVVVDPPRGGIRDLIPMIVQLPFRRMVYVSCHLAALCRDLSWLVSQGGFEVLESTPFDMFPHTYHLESVTVLDRAC